MTLSWCPDEDTLSRLEHYAIRLEAKIAGADAWAERDYFLRFNPSRDSACTSRPPRVNHDVSTVVRVSGGILIQAHIEDDLELEIPPIVIYGVGSQDAVESMGQWKASAFSRVADTLWEATIPADLSQGGVLHYQVVVTDNDDPDGTTCDQIVRTDWYKTELAGSVVPLPQWRHLRPVRLGSRMCVGGVSLR